MLKGKKTVNLKDIKESQENRMRKSSTENITVDLNDCGFKGFSDALLNTKRKRDAVHRCYGNDTKKRRTKTSEDHAFEVSFYDPKQIFLTISIEFQIVIMVCSDFINVFHFCCFMFCTFTLQLISSIENFHSILFCSVVNQRIHSFFKCVCFTD
jgi:hypothetical protein